jgi:hypothetical protein
MGSSAEELDEQGYEDLGRRHPLRRVSEEGKENDQFTLPSIKSLFGAAGMSLCIVDPNVG